MVVHNMGKLFEPTYCLHAGYAGLQAGCVVGTEVTED